MNAYEEEEECEHLSQTFSPGRSGAFITVAGECTSHGDCSQ